MKIPTEIKKYFFKENNEYYAYTILSENYPVKPLHGNKKYKCLSINPFYETNKFDKFLDLQIWSLTMVNDKNKEINIYRKTSDIKIMFISKIDFRNKKLESIL